MEWVFCPLDLLSTSVSELVLPRTDPVQKRKQFHLYVGEFQRYATDEFALFLTQPIRTFGIGTTIAHQARRQLNSNIGNACLAAANLMVFRVLPEDGHALAYQFDTTLPPASVAQFQQRRTEEEMAQKIADELTTLPDFVARMRIAKGQSLWIIRYTSPSLPKHTDDSVW